MKRLEFLAMVQTVLSENPEWLSDCLLAAATGMRNALEFAAQKRAASDAATLAALALVQTPRLTPETRKSLNSVVCRAINSKNMAPIERKFLEAAQ